jgi:uncharacterized protein YggU (UPF0235/DUF167 family)
MGTVFTVRTHANAKRFSLRVFSESPLELSAEVPAAPEKGRANAFLLVELERLLSCRVEILSGKTARKKRLAADLPAVKLLEKIKNGEKHGKNIH